MGSALVGWLAAGSHCVVARCVHPSHRPFIPRLNHHSSLFVTMFRAARTAATTARVARGYATQASAQALGEEFVATRAAVKQHAAGA